MWIDISKLVLLTTLQIVVASAAAASSRSPRSATNLKEMSQGKRYKSIEHSVGKKVLHCRFTSSQAFPLLEAAGTGVAVHMDVWRNQMWQESRR